MSFKSIVHENQIYCPFCESCIDIDSKICKFCGKNLNSMPIIVDSVDFRFRPSPDEGVFTEDVLKRYGFNIVPDAYKMNFIVGFSLILDKALEFSKKDIIQTYEKHKNDNDLDEHLLNKSIFPNGDKLGFYNYSKYNMQFFKEYSQKEEKDYNEFYCMLKEYFTCFDENTKEIFNMLNLDDALDLFYKLDALYSLFYIDFELDSKLFQSYDVFIKDYKEFIHAVSLSQDTKFNLFTSKKSQFYSFLAKLLCNDFNLSNKDEIKIYNPFYKCGTLCYEVEKLIDSQYPNIKKIIYSKEPNSDFQSIGLSRHILDKNFFFDVSGLKGININNDKINSVDLIIADLTQEDFSNFILKDMLLFLESLESNFKAVIKFTTPLLSNTYPYMDKLIINDYIESMMLLPQNGEFTDVILILSNNKSLNKKGKFLLVDEFDNKTDIFRDSQLIITLYNSYFNFKEYKNARIVNNDEVILLDNLEREFDDFNFMKRTLAMEYDVLKDIGENYEFITKFIESYLSNQGASEDNSFNYDKYDFAIFDNNYYYKLLKNYFDVLFSCFNGFDSYIVDFNFKYPIFRNRHINYLEHHDYEILDEDVIDELNRFIEEHSIDFKVFYKNFRKIPQSYKEGYNALFSKFEKEINQPFKFNSSIMEYYKHFNFHNLMYSQKRVWDLNQSISVVPLAKYTHLYTHSRSIKWVNGEERYDFKKEYNSIFINKSKVTEKHAYYSSEIPEDLDKTNFIECECYSDNLLKDYIYHYLNSKRGHDEILFFSRGDKELSDISLSYVNIPLPSIEEQKKIINAVIQSNEFFKSFQLLQDQFQKNILDYNEILEDINSFRGVFNFNIDTGKFKMSKNWMHLYQGLIWPLASSYLSATHGSSEIVQKANMYLRLFEFIAAFNTIILLSGIPKEEYEKVKFEIWNSKDSFYFNMTFGTWYHLIMNLSEIYRRNSFSTSINKDLFLDISNDTCLEIYKKAKDIRNFDAHNFTMDEYDANEIIDELNPYLNNLYDILTIYLDYKLYYIKEIINDGNIRYKVFKLNGPCGQPIHDELIFNDKLLKPGCLYLHNPLNNELMEIDGRFMKLLPTDKREKQWAIFIFNGTELKGNVLKARYKCLQQRLNDYYEVIENINQIIK